jgi:hypothetical protein
MADNEVVQQQSSGVGDHVHSMRIEYALGTVHIEMEKSRGGFRKFLPKETEYGPVTAFLMLKRTDEAFSYMTTLEEPQIKELQLMSALGEISSGGYRSLADKYPHLHFEHEHCKALFGEKVTEAMANGLQVRDMTEDVVFDSYPIGRYVKKKRG